MTLKTPAEQAATDLAALFSADMPWVKAVSYTPSGGEAAEIAAIVTYGENLESSGRMVGARATATMRVRKSDVASPGYKDAVVIDGSTWHVLRRLSGDAFTWKLEIEGDMRVSFRD